MMMVAFRKLRAGKLGNVCALTGLAVAMTVSCSSTEPGDSDENGSGGASGGASSDASGGAFTSGGQPGETGGTSSGTGGSDPLGTGGASVGTGGVAPSSGGSGTGGETSGDPAAPEGSIPNEPQDPSRVSTDNNNWQVGLISETLESGHHNQPSIINGYLMLSGNSLMAMYDISDPTDPEQLSFEKSPGAGAGEAEGHQVSFAKYGDTLYAATIQGKGIDIWDVTNARDPKHVKAIQINGINYGDFTEAVWGIAWQGSTIYVGGTSTGVHVIDAADPSQAKIVISVPQGQLGNVNAGPLFAIGNTLVVTTPKSNAGIATLDISDPHKPMVLDSLIPAAESYIGGFYGHHAYLLNPIRVYDVLSNPTEITTVNGNRPGGYWEYMSFQDGFMFAGRIRPNPGADKIDVSDLGNFSRVGSIIGRRNLSAGAPENDDQFTVAVGNLLILSDDQLTTSGQNAGTYAGTVIAVHDTKIDTTPPHVDTILPRDGATGQAVTSRIGISFTDNIELATVDNRSFIVRPMGGSALEGTFSVTMTLLNFDPAENLAPGTTYEVILPAGGVKDYVGNGVEEFRTTFTTK